MADNKQSITKVQENGTIVISEDVLITIITNTIQDVEGVVSISSKPGADIVDMIGVKGWGKGLKITICEDDSLTIDCNVVLAYGQSVVNVAAAIQDAVSAALESTTGVKVLAVNVNVCGISAQ